MRVEITPWTLTWTGGRLGDVHHLEHPSALDCVEVGSYDWQRGRLLREPDEAALRERLAEWIADNGDDYVREMPFLP